MHTHTHEHSAIIVSVMCGNYSPAETWPLPPHVRLFVWLPLHSESSVLPCCCAKRLSCSWCRIILIQPPVVLSFTFFKMIQEESYCKLCHCIAPKVWAVMGRRKNIIYPFLLRSWWSNCRSKYYHNISPIINFVGKWGLSSEPWCNVQSLPWTLFLYSTWRTNLFVISLGVPLVFHNFDW